jgi:3-hydroxybutyryl-CoA dehydratase
VSLAAGSELDPLEVGPVEVEGMRAVGEILDDPNPIHFDPAAASAAGLGDRPINQGPANIAYVLDMLRANLPEATVGDLDVRLLGNVAAGDRVVAGGRVESSEEGGGPIALRATVWLEVIDGGRALEGTAILSIA